MESLLFAEHLVGRPVIKLVPPDWMSVTLLATNPLSKWLEALVNVRAMSLTIEELSSEPYCQAHLFADDVPESQKKALLEQLNAIDGSLPGTELGDIT